MKSLIRVFFATACIVNSVFIGYAAQEEEKRCFNILTPKVLALYGVNLANVWNGSSFVDISQYGNAPGQKFRKEREKVSGNPFFNSQRNNIGTIVLSSDYITTQYVPFGNATDFLFPIDNGGALIGDQLVNFKNQQVYTHHNIFDGGSFLSCGYLRITPIAPYSYFDLDPANYFSNILDGGGFEIESSREIDLTGGMGTGHYIITKSKVTGATLVTTGALNELKKLFNIEILHVVYDNNSSYFNEYETFPLQVDAMTNADAFSTAFSVQQDFLNRVMNETCLAAVHPTVLSLPAMCAGTYQSKSANTRSTRSFASTFDTPSNGWYSKLYSYLIPNAFARLSDEEIEQVREDIDPNDTGTGRTIMMNQNFNYFEFEILNKIPTKLFREYFLLASSYHYDVSLQKRKQNPSELSEYDKILLGCEIPYSERVSLLKEWLNNLDVSTFSLESIEYPNPKIGDCVLPYPDKRNVDKEIPGSFESNKRYARYLIALKNSVADPKIEGMRSELRTIESEYSKALLEANQVIASGDVSRGQKLLRDAGVEYEPKIQEIQDRMYGALNPSAPPRGVSSNQTIALILIGAGVLLAFVLVFFRRKK